MAKITKSVNKTIVNGSEIFIYKIDASYSDLTTPAEEGKIIDVFPSRIKYILPPVGGNIKSITETPVPGGSQVIFNLGSINAGTSLSFTIGCYFGPGRVDNDSFTNTVDLVADDKVIASGTAPPVNLVLKENFKLRKFGLPSNIVNPDEEITLVLSLTNDEPGAVISNVVISDVLPEQLIPVTDYIPIGNDVTVDGYSDTSANGLLGSWDGNKLIFNLPRYSGARYDIKFKVKVASDLRPGERFTNIGKWTVDDIEREEAPLELIVYDADLASFDFFKRGTRTTFIGGPIVYDLVNSNTGNLPLNNYTMEDIIPQQIDITRLRVTARTGLTNYSLFLALDSQPNNYLPIIENVVSGSVPLQDLTPLIPSGDRIAKIKLVAQGLEVEDSYHILSMFGQTNTKAVPNERFENIGTVTSGSLTKTAVLATTVNGASDLSVSKDLVPSLDAYYPLEEFNIILEGSARNTITVEPILADLMPEGLRYILDSEYYLYNDYETGTVYDSRNPGFPISLPTREIISNFADTGQTLLRWSFNDFVLPTRCSIKVVFKVFVEINSPDYFTNKAYEGMPGNNVLFVYNEIDDPLDIDGDGLTTDDKLSYAEIEGIILSTSEFSIKKLVKGQEDLDYSNSGLTVQGGNIDYRLQVTNNQSIDLRDIEIIDILPHIGDTGVILLDQQRGSQFDIYASSAVTAKIINLVGDPVDPNPDIIIEYSTSNDPIRFDQLGNIIGSGSWSLEPPENITNLGSIKITTGPNLVLKPYERLIIDFVAKAPVGVSANQIAYNSFAVKANKIIGQTTEPLLPTEPNKVAVKILGTREGSIGDFVWEDLNGNGIYDPGEPGVNGITVELYSEDGSLLDSTITANNINGDPGYYLFTGLEEGIYQVKFVTFGDYSLTQQEAALENGSKPNPSTGFTNFISLSRNQNILDIDAGIVTEICSHPIICAIDKCINVGECFDPMEGVKAIDCLGRDITSKIQIVENNVNIHIPGIYTITYEVIDNNKKTVKTIYVRVCDNRRFQALTDMIQSIALEQTALSHILNAEGEKIQKIKDLNLSSKEILKINNSVNNMVKAITRLEMIMQIKLETFECNKCDGNCCDDFNQS